MADRRIPERTTFLAVLGLPALLGALAGLADALTSIGPGRPFTVGFLLFTASLGAALGLAASLPVVVVFTALRRPRRAGARLAAVATLALLSPAVLALGRLLYKRIPWGAGDVLLGLAGIAAVLLVVAVAAALGGAQPRRRQAATVELVARLAFPAILLAAPSAFRLLAATGPPSAGRAGDPGATNLLLLTIDTLRPDALGVTGSPTVRTPWIDRLARRGVQPAECIAPSPWTLPSLGTILTGAYPGQHRVLEQLSGLAPGVTTLAEACRADGRRTAAFVSNPWLATGSLARGFDRFDVAERLECLDPARGTRLAQAVSKAVLRTVRLDSADRLSAQGIAWVEHGEGSWFLWVHYFDPHLPNWPGPPWDRLGGTPPHLVGSSLTVEEIRRGAFPGGEAGRREIEALYDGEVAYTDHGIGRLVRALEARDGLARTAIVFSADHGEELWDHAGYGHGHAMWDEVVRVPFVVRPPGGVPGRVDPALARLVDLAPTALAAADVAPPDTPPLPGPAPGTAYGEAVLYGPEQKFLRVGGWKLVYRPGVPDSLRLFDLARDPGERRDLAGSDPVRADSLRVELLGWRALVGSEGALAARDLPESLDPQIRAQLEALGYLQ